MINYLLNSSLGPNRTNFIKKEVLLIAAFCFLHISSVFAQPANDNCVTAVSLDNTSANTNITQSLAGATASIGHPAVCTGNADDDVWFTFTASSTKQIIRLIPTSGFNGLMQVLSGCTPASTVLSCLDLDPADGAEEKIKITSLTPGTVYYVRVFSHETGATTTTDFDISSYRVPDHDDCDMAKTLIVSPAGNIVLDSVTGSTMSMSPCGGFGNSEDDIWFKFVASASDNTITLEPTAYFDAVLELLDGCSGNSLTCKNDGGLGDNERLEPTTLIPGNTYYLRVYDIDPEDAVSPPFNIYVRGTQIQSVLKVQIENSLTIYPVPANNILNVNFSAPASGDINMKLISSEGKIVYANSLGQLSGDVHETIELSKLNKGIYLLQVVVNEELISKKIIVN